MPKPTKKRALDDSSDSDSGPDDRNPPRGASGSAKKAKSGGASSSGTSSRMANESEPTWDLGKMKRIKVPKLITVSSTFLIMVD